MIFWVALITITMANLEIIKIGGLCITDNFLENGWAYCREVSRDSWPNMSYGFIYIYLLLNAFSSAGLFLAFYSRRQQKR